MAAVIRREWRRHDGGVGGDGSVMAARRQQWWRLEGDKGCGNDSMRVSRWGEEGRGGVKRPQEEIQLINFL